MSTQPLSPPPDTAVERVVTIGQAIPGFPELSELAIMPIDGYGMFVWLTSPETFDVAFLAVNPFPFFPEYDVELSDVDEALLAAERGDDLIVYCLVTVDRASGQATANLLAPVVVNASRARALQVILEGEHPLRAPLEAPGVETPTAEPS